MFSRVSVCPHGGRVFLATGPFRGVGISVACPFLGVGYQGCRISGGRGRG